ncbi:hypothetical protein BJ170DRAFT_683318 [Xylariales sp. AK1849]|nr:hypothetical protein BJ170DRAFT_683318 [Xylariales sp. AK1849]
MARISRIRRSPRRPPKLVQLLALASTTSALSLANFQLITSSSIPSPCIVAYNTQIEGCTTTDFTKGNLCSTSCMNGVTQEATIVNAICGGLQRRDYGGCDCSTLDNKVIFLDNKVIFLDNKVIFLHNYNTDTDGSNGSNVLKLTGHDLYNRCKYINSRDEHSSHIYGSDIYGGNIFGGDIFGGDIYGGNHHIERRLASNTGHQHPVR